MYIRGFFNEYYDQWRIPQTKHQLLKERGVQACIFATMSKKICNIKKKSFGGPAVPPGSVNDEKENPYFWKYSFTSTVDVN